MISMAALLTAVAACSDDDGGTGTDTEFEALLSKHSCEIVAASASNFLSLRNEEELSSIASDPAKSATWQAFLDWETEYCKEPGALDGGTHIIAVARRI